jgi:transcriptional regulator GlxA family with amidase domain
MLEKLLTAAWAALDSDRDIAKACIQRAAELVGAFRSESKQPGPGSRVVRGGLACWQQKRLLTYVEVNIGSDIRISDLARLVALSTGHFFRAFRESFGEPPLSYVTKQRIRHAQELMLSSSTPLCQIALECGMCDQPHFTRVFRRIVGVNPAQWRRQTAVR